MTNEETSNKPPHREMHDVHRNRMAWISDGDLGHFEAVEDFNFDAVDEALGHIITTPDDSRAIAADLLSKLLVWTWSKPSSSRAALVKFTALSGGLRPDLLENRTYLELAKECGVSKAAISKSAVLFQRAFGIHFARSRTDEARRHMAAKQVGHANYHHRKP